VVEIRGAYDWEAARSVSVATSQEGSPVDQSVSLGGYYPNHEGSAHGLTVELETFGEQTYGAVRVDRELVALIDTKDGWLYPSSKRQHPDAFGHAKQRENPVLKAAFETAHSH